MAAVSPAPSPLRARPAAKRALTLVAATSVPPIAPASLLPEGWLLDWVSSPRVATACIVVAVLGYLLAWGCLYADATTVTAGMAVFALTSPLALALQIGRFNRDKFALVLRTFEFWYLSANVLVFCMITAVAEYSVQGAPLWLSVTTFLLIVLATACFVVAQDASPYKPLTRARIMVFFTLFWGAGFVSLLDSLAPFAYPPPVQEALTSPIDVWLFHTTPMALSSSTSLTLTLFFGRYAFLSFWRGREYVLITASLRDSFVDAEDENGGDTSARTSVESPHSRLVGGGNAASPPAALGDQA